MSIYNRFNKEYKYPYQNWNTEDKQAFAENPHYKMTGSISEEEIIKGNVQELHYPYNYFENNPEIDSYAVLNEIKLNNDIDFVYLIIFDKNNPLTIDDYDNITTFNGIKLYKNQVYNTYYLLQSKHNETTLTFPYIWKRNSEATPTTTLKFFIAYGYNMDRNNNNEMVNNYQKTK